MSTRRRQKEVTLPNPHAFINSLEQSDAALIERSRGLGRARALGSAALKLVERHEMAGQPTHDLGLYGLRLIGRMPGFIEGSAKLEAERSGNHNNKLHYEERVAVKRDIIAFNDVVRDLVNYQPHLKMSNVIDYISASAIHLSDGQPVQNLPEAARQTVDGMRHEIAFEGALYGIEGFEEVYPATPEQDRKGIDMIVMYRGMEIPIDVKASQHGVVRSAERQANYRGGEVSVPLWSGVSWDDFGDSLRITDDRVIARQAEYIGQHLEMIYQMGCENYVSMV